MAHKDYHPKPVENCFGCKVSSIGFDGGHLTKTVRDEVGSDITLHRSGRVDVMINPQPVKFNAAAFSPSEEK